MPARGAPLVHQLEVEEGVHQGLADGDADRGGDVLRLLCRRDLRRLEAVLEIPDRREAAEGAERGDEPGIVALADEFAAVDGARRLGRRQWVRVVAEAVDERLRAAAGAVCERNPVDEGDRVVSRGGGVEHLHAPRMQLVVAARQQRLVLRRRSPPVGARVRLVPDDDGARVGHERERRARGARDRKSTRLNSSHVSISYAVFCLKKKKKKTKTKYTT